MYEASLLILILIIIILLVALYQKSTNAICISRKRLEGRTVLVTGGTAGMGLEIAKDLAHRGARVIVACPFEQEGVHAVKQIIEESENKNVVFKILDLSSLDSIRMFASKILANEQRLDILVNNAGVGLPCDAVTTDGMQFIMQVNYYGSIFLTLLLLPLLIKTGKSEKPSRILFTSSILHYYGTLDFENWNTENYYWLKMSIYGNSKLGLVLFANELAKRLKYVSNSNVVVNCVDPGAVGTGIFASVNRPVGFLLKYGCKILFKTSWEGAQTALHVALDKKAGEVSGGFFKNCQLTRARSVAYCDKTCNIVWEKSIKLLKLSTDELEKCFKSL